MHIRLLPWEQVLCSCDASKVKVHTGGGGGRREAGAHSVHLKGT